MIDSFIWRPCLPGWVRAILIALACVAAVLLSAGGWALYANGFAIREQRVTIPGPAEPLDAVLALPKAGKGPLGLVVFVRGDGPAGASRDSFDRPIWRRDLLTAQTYPHGSHSLAREDLENNPYSVKAYAVGAFAPRQLYAPSYLDNLRRHVQELPAAKEAR